MGKAVVICPSHWRNNEVDNAVIRQCIAIVLVYH